ncbi:hypothetical protein V1264_016483 [Littorina saxatilis]|uniref:RNase H type-1 domain-containing protein n=1 Tax=Littorina saxatilis TaxID=31220 RepID=A0AAN9BMN4_9CAEN
MVIVYEHVAVSTLLAMISDQQNLEPALSMNTRVILNTIINFMWAPSHMGIQGNDAADKAAKDAPKMAVPPLPEQFVFFTDLRRKTLFYSLKLWQDRWSTCKENKLYKIHPELSKPFPLLAASRKDESVLARLHTGHTYTTHVHLLKREKAPWCHACDNSFSVSHFLTECADLYDLRVKYFDTSSLKHIFTKVSSAALFGFLKESLTRRVSI